MRAILEKGIVNRIDGSEESDGWPRRWSLGGNGKEGIYGQGGGGSSATANGVGRLRMGIMNEVGGGSTTPRGDDALEMA